MSENIKVKDSNLPPPSEDEDGNELLQAFNSDNPIELKKEIEKLKQDVEKLKEDNQYLVSQNVKA
mgnify:CR=1 FL=1